MSNNQETSVIAEDATVTGNVDFVGTLIVEGKMEGDIKGADMTIQQTGRITGTLKVDSLNCHGEIDGNIKAKQIIAHNSAILTGEIEADSFEMAPGARLNGTVSMGNPSAKKLGSTNANTAKKIEPAIPQAKAQSNAGQGNAGKGNTGQSNTGKDNTGQGKASPSNKPKGSKLSDLVLD